MKRHAPPFILRDIKLEVTYRCNLNCVHCSSDARPSNSLEMNNSDCLRILDDAVGIGVRDVAFSGGEPLLWPNLSEAVEAAAERRMNITIYTSGIAEGFDRAAVSLHDLGASRFVFSLFGATPYTHERITRKAGSFERTKSAMQDALSAGLTTELHFVPMSSNYRELNDVARLARDLGASRLSVLRFVPQGRGVLVRYRVLNRIQNLELRRQILVLRKEHGDNFIRTGSPYNFLLLNDQPACSAAIDRLIIGPDLRLYPCDAFKRIDASELVKTMELSSLAGTSLSDCWERSPYLKSVRTYLTTDFQDPCSSCCLLEKCLSGCLAQKVIATESLDKRSDPDCLGPNFRGDLE